MTNSGLADSPFFAAVPQPASHPQESNTVVEKPNERTVFRTEKRTEIRTVKLPIRRDTKRYSFEFYNDQISRLKKLKYQAEIAGQSINLSEMVRQALDTYLKDKNA